MKSTKQKVFSLAVTGICLTSAVFITLLPVTGRSQGTVNTIAKKRPAPVADTTIVRLKASIEANPDDLTAHEAYIKAIGVDSVSLLRQYEQWLDKFPQSATVPFALGEAYSNRESPKARPYLLKAIALDPKLAKAYLMLAIDAERWGDNDGAREYMGKATAADPSDPGYAFYYAMDFEKIDPAKWRTKLFELAQRFPTNERGAQGLYWLAARSTDTAEKIRVYEQLRAAYAPEKFNWSSGGMSGLFDIYLTTAPDKAIALAKSMGTDGGWPQQVELAQNVLRVRRLMDEHKFPDALSLANQIRTPRYSSAVDMIALLKAAIRDGAGLTQQAYDSLVVLFARAPGDELYKGMELYGAKLGKKAAGIDADVWKVRDAATTVAPAFDLRRYTSAGTASLNDYKGKVVLLTFWFPGCGPCRGEFPHFETVLSKFKGKNVDYIGINVDTTQDDYVTPFMKGTQYTFTPLRASNEWAATTYKVRGEPTNFLIDQQGQIVFTNFRASDPHSERSLELMISSLLSHGGSTSKTN
jgi:peroxiredoxin/tetratricopeptide (TPR) repeat protein